MQQTENVKQAKKAYQKCRLSGIDEISEKILEHFNEQDKACERVYDLSRQVVPLMGTAHTAGR